MQEPTAFVWTNWFCFTALCDEIARWSLDGYKGINFDIEFTSGTDHGIQRKWLLMDMDIWQGVEVTTMEFQAIELKSGCLMKDLLFRVRLQ